MHYKTTVMKAFQYWWKAVLHTDSSVVGFSYLKVVLR